MCQLFSVLEGDFERKIHTEIHTDTDYFVECSGQVKKTHMNTFEFECC